MKVKKISFKNYKAFSDKQVLELKPITLLIGKNSSGKSAIAKLPTLLETSLAQKIDAPLLLSNNDVVLGNEFRDLVFNKYPNSPVEFSICFEDNRELTVNIVQLVGSPTLLILSWHFKSSNIDFLISYDERKEAYIDKDGAAYNCSFKGILPVSIKKIPNHEEIISQLDLIDLAINVDYIGPFRLMPPRFFSLTGQVNYNHTGVRGENAYYILGNSKLYNTSLVDNVGKWYEEHFDEWRLDVSENKDPLLEIVLFKEDKKEDFTVNLADVGQGMSQALPLIVRAYMEVENSLVILEQPELHLHPAAHGDLAELFAMSALEKNQNYLIETHSENFLLRLRRLIVDNDCPLKAEDVVIYWIDNDEENGYFLDKITIDEKGILSDWPEGVFNENVQEILAIRKTLKAQNK